MLVVPSIELQLHPVAETHGGATLCCLLKGNFILKNIKIN